MSTEEIFEQFSQRVGAGVADSLRVLALYALGAVEQTGALDAATARDARVGLTEQAAEVSRLFQERLEGELGRLRTGALAWAEAAVENRQVADLQSKLAQVEEIHGPTAHLMARAAELRQELETAEALGTEIRSLESQLSDVLNRHPDATKNALAELAAEKSRLEVELRAVQQAVTDATTLDGEIRELKQTLATQRDQHPQAFRQASELVRLQKEHDVLKTGAHSQAQLEHQCATLRTEIAALQTEFPHIAILATTLDELEDTRQMYLDTSLGRLREEIATKRRELEVLELQRPDVAELLKELSRVREEVALLHKQGIDTALLTDLEGLRAELQTLREVQPRMTELLLEGEQLRQDIERFRAAASNPDSTLQEIEALRQEYELQHRAAQGSGQLLAEADALRQRLAEMTRLAADHELLTKTVADLRTELSFLVSTTPALSMIEELQTKLAQTRASLEDPVALEAEVTRLQHDLDDLRASDAGTYTLLLRKQRLADDLAEFRATSLDATACNAEVLALQQEYALMRERHPEVESIQSHKLRLQRQVQDFARAVENPTETLEAISTIQGELEALRQKNSSVIEMSNVVEELRAERERLTDMANSKEELVAEQKRLQEELRDLKANYPEVFRLMDANSALHTQLQDIKNGDIDAEALREDVEKLRTHLLCAKDDFPEVAALIAEKVRLIGELDDFFSCKENVPRLEQSCGLLREKLEEVYAADPGVFRLQMQEKRLKDELADLEANGLTAECISARRASLEREIDALKQVTPEAAIVLDLAEQLQTLLLCVTDPAYLQTEESRLRAEIATVSADNQMAVERIRTVEQLRRDRADLTEVTDHGPSVAEVEAMQNELVTLREQANATIALTTKRDTLASELESLNDTVGRKKALQDEVAALQQELASKRRQSEDVLQLQADILGLRQAIADATTSTVDELEAEKTALETKLLALRKDRGIATLGADIDHLRNAIASFKACQRNPAFYEQQREQLEEELNILRRANPTLAKQLELLEGLERQNDNLRGMIANPAAVSARYTSATEELAAITRDHGDVLSTYNQIVALEETLRGVHTGSLTVDRLAEKRESLRAAIDALLAPSGLLRTLYEDCCTLEQQLEHLSDPTAGGIYLEKRKALLATELETRLARSPELLLLQQRVTELEKEVQQCTPGVLEARIAELQQRLVGLKEANPNISRLLTEAEDLQELYYDCTKALGNPSLLQARVLHLHTIIDALRHQDSDVDRSVGQILEARGRLNELQRYLGDRALLDEELTMLTVQLDACQAENPDLVEKIMTRLLLAERLKDCQQYSEDPDLLERQVASLHEAVAKAEQQQPQVTRLIEERQALEVALRGLQQNLARGEGLKIEVEELRARLEQLKRENRPLTNLIEEREAMQVLIAEIQNAALHPEEAEQAHSRIYEKFYDLITSTKEFGLLHSENEGLRRDVAALNRQLSAMDELMGENLHLERELQKAREQLRDQSRQLTLSSLEASRGLDRTAGERRQLEAEAEWRRGAMDRLINVDLPRVAVPLIRGVSPYTPRDGH
ncbi:hypothetical protein GMRT_10116 [Giardia muris]|uniref:Coiled-coil protein n=1 Tax=Giardia muris TaxID=5742 RepID=A0A4Z1SPN5_GIAMU|nr:hypothetical protein GMRT_10116 [Giardia muris]|eukprot:TNJ27766.1 hypothetical protein GMRT_10116 [Giardia muris]